MAPPPNRRPGYSRRAQYGLFAGYVIAVVGAAIGLLLVVTAVLDPVGHARIQSVFADITSPVSSAARSAMSGTRGAYDEVAAYFDAASKNRAMQTELNAAKAELIKRRNMEGELGRMKRLARLVERTPGQVVTARLVASTGASTRRYATLAAGSADGVRNGQQVSAPGGLVGRVVQTGRFSARVLLIVDPGNIVPVKRLGDDFPAFAVGRADGRLDIRAIEAGSNPFKPGDIFVTSGTGGIYAPGIAVALARVRGRDVTLAVPTADPAGYDFAVVSEEFVVPPPQPPAPAP